MAAEMGLHCLVRDVSPNTYGYYVSHILETQAIIYSEVFELPESRVPGMMKTDKGTLQVIVM